MARPRQPYVSITGTVGGVATTRRIPVAVDSQNRALPVDLSPDVAFPDSIVVGPSEQRSDQRTAQVIFNGLPGGVGEDAYTETEGIATSRDAQLDTRYPQSIVLPPEDAQIGSTIVAGRPQRGFYTPFSDRKYFTWGGSGHAYSYKPSTNSWVDGTLFGTPVDAALVQGHVFVLGQSALWRSDDGITYNTVTVDTGIPIGNYVGLCAWDNKLWLLGWNSAGALTVRFSTDYLSAAVAGAVTATWTAATPLQADGFTTLFAGACRLFVWRYPPNSGYPALWLANGHHLYYYDEIGGANVWKYWAASNKIGFPADGEAALPLTIWERSGNLYQVPRKGQQHVKEWTGSTEDMLGPNERAALPAGSATAFNVLDGNGHWLVAFGDNTPTSPATVGRVWAMDEGRGWHCVYSSAGPIWGGWVGPETLCVVAGASGSVKVYELPFADDRALPRNATAHTFRPNVELALETADTDGGTPYVLKRATRMTVDPRDATNASALPASTTMGIDYAADGATSWTLLANMTSSDDFPKSLPFPAGGLPFYRIRFRVRMETTDHTVSPDLAMFALHFIRRPKRRYARTFRLDLRDDGPAFKNARRTYNRYSASSLRKWLLAVADGQAGEVDSPLVSFSYGGRGNSTSPTYVSVGLADLVLTPQDDSDGGTGRVAMTLRDLSADVAS